MQFCYTGGNEEWQKQFWKNSMPIEKNFYSYTVEGSVKDI